MGRGTATGIVMLMFMTVIALFLIIIIPYMHQKLLSISKNLPLFTERIFQLTSPLWERFSTDFGLPTLEQLKNQILSHVGDIAQVIVGFLLNILGSGMVIANIISLLILTPIVMFYFLKDWPQFLKQLEKFIPIRFRPYIFRYTKRVDETLAAYAKGQMAVCGLLMIIYIILLSLIHLPDAFFIGFLTGFLAFIPYLGALIGLSLSLIVSCMHFVGWWQLIAILGVFFAVNLLEGNVITPRLIGKKTGLHPIWIIFSLLAAATWFGFMGVILAIPVAAMLSAIFRLLLEEYYHSSLYTKV